MNSKTNSILGKITQEAERRFGSPVQETKKNPTRDYTVEELAKSKDLKKRRRGQSMLHSSEYGKKVLKEDESIIRKREAFMEREIERARSSGQLPSREEVLKDPFIKKMYDKKR